MVNGHTSPVPAAAPTAQPHAPMDREVRLGVVLYGGVSLAIYINGVVQEFARVVRGQGSYRWVKALTDSDVVVDVISGTSAGGINGIALAHALCNELDLATLPRLWREHGDIAALLHTSSKNSPPLRSLLDGDEYQRKLKQAFDDLASAPFVPEAGSEQYVSRGPELDLFITGTSLDGQKFIEFDDRGHALTVNEHRVLFWIKHREGRKEELDIGAGGHTRRVATALDTASGTGETLADHVGVPRRVSGGRSPGGRPGSVHAGRSAAPLGADPEGDERLLRRRRRAGQQALYVHPGSDLLAPCDTRCRAHALFRRPGPWQCGPRAPRRRHGHRATRAKLRPDPVPGAGLTCPSLRRSPTI